MKNHIPTSDSGRRSWYLIIATAMLALVAMSNACWNIEQEQNLRRIDKEISTLKERTAGLVRDFNNEHQIFNRTNKPPRK